MRHLSEIEKDLCLRILKGDGPNNYLGNVIDDKLKGVRIYVDRTKPSVAFRFQTTTNRIKGEELEALHGRVYLTALEIVTAINLLNLLEKEGYVIIFQKANVLSSTFEFGRGVGNLPYVENDLSDSRISALLIDYCEKEIIVTEEFRLFCKNGFIARDEQRFRRQIRFTRIALIVAITAVVLTTSFSLRNMYSDEREVRQKQVDSVLKELNAIKNNVTKLR